MARLVIIAAIFISCLGFTSTASAGILESIKGFISPNVGATIPLTENSQRMSLLKPVLNSVQYESRGGGEIITDDYALSAPTGPIASAGNDSDDELYRDSRISIYVVHSGDTLADIAKMFDVSVDTIKWANDITTGGISVGQTLIILPISGVQHDVKKGETLDSIAKLYKSDKEDIAIFNDIDSEAVLSLGEKLIIPGGKEGSTVNKTVTSKKTISKFVHGVGGPLIPGYFARPLRGGVQTQGLHGYNGVDIGAPRGTEVLAAASGIVVTSRDGWNVGYGRMIVINHPNGTQTLYAHLSASFVNPGDEVSQGQVIGAVGSTGRSTGPHLHFEVRGAANPFAK